MILAGIKRQAPVKAALEICVQDGLSMAYSQEKIYRVLSLQSPQKWRQHTEVTVESKIYVSIFAIMSPWYQKMIGLPGNSLGVFRQANQLR